MSGSKSSSRGDAAPPEALGLTVHDLAVPDAVRADKQTRVGRFKLLLVLALCAAPVIVSYWMYYVVRPQARTSHGVLVQPTRAMAGVALRDARSGQAVDTNALRGQWLIMAAAPAACDNACRERLHALRQLREMMGRDRDRVEKVWLVVGPGALPADLAQPDPPDPASHLLRLDEAVALQWLQPPDGRLQGQLYIVDPMGEYMMRLPLPLEPSKAKRDLERLLRASSSWDRAGR